MPCCVKGYQCHWCMRGSAGAQDICIFIGDSQTGCSVRHERRSLLRVSSPRLDVTQARGHHFQVNLCQLLFLEKVGRRYLRPSWVAVVRRGEPRRKQDAGQQKRQQTPQIQSLNSSKYMSFSFRTQTLSSSYNWRVITQTYCG